MASILPLGNVILQFLSSRVRLCFPTFWIWTDLISYFWTIECSTDHVLVPSLDPKKPWSLLFFLSELCHCHENKLGPACWRMSHHVQAELSHASEGHPRPFCPQSVHQLTLGGGPVEISQVSSRSAELMRINKWLSLKPQSFELACLPAITNR